MRYRQRVLGFLFFLSVITYVDRVCISVAGRTIQQDLGLSPQQWGWVLGAFTISYALFEIPSGALSDRIGSRRVLTRIVTWWSVFTAITGLVTGFWQMIVARFLFGAGEAGAFPGASSAIARWFPAIERARAQGVVWMASRVGGAIAPLLVIPLQMAFGWRVSFYIFGAIGTVWAMAWYFWYRDNPADQPGISATEVAEINDGQPTPSHQAVSWKRLLSQPALWAIMVMYFCYCWSGFFYLSWLHTFLEVGRGFSKADLIALSWIPFALGGCANIAGGFTSDYLVRKIGLKWGRRAVGVTGLTLSAGFILAAMLTESKVLTLAFLALGYAGSDFMLPVAWAVCLDVGHKHAGAITGAMNTAGQVGSFCSTVAFGYIVAAAGSYNAPLLPIAIMTALSAILWLKIDPTKRLA